MSPDDAGTDSPPTAAGRGPSDETTLVPPTTTATPDLAWSLEDALGEPTRASWRRTAAISIAALAVACLVAISTWALLRREAPPARPDIVTTTTVITAPAAAPATTTVTIPATTTVTIPATPTTPDDPDLDANDRAFLQALQRDGITIPIHAKALAGAHWACNQYRGGATRDDIIATLKNSNPGLSDQGAVDFLAAAVIFYCPQYA